MPVPWILVIVDLQCIWYVIRQDHLYYSSLTFSSWENTLKIFKNMIIFTTFLYFFFFFFFRLGKESNWRISRALVLCLVAFKYKRWAVWSHSDAWTFVTLFSLFRNLKDLLYVPVFWNITMICLSVGLFSSSMQDIQWAFSIRQLRDVFQFWEILLNYFIGNFFPFFFFLYLLLFRCGNFWTSSQVPFSVLSCFLFFFFNIPLLLRFAFLPAWLLFLGVLFSLNVLF